MSDVVSLLPPLVVGVLLGAMFYAGLWWTVQRVVSSKQPALWFVGSQLLRTSVALAGFYWIASSHWERLLVCLLGFVVARLMVMRLTQATETKVDSVQEARHAP